ncbi:PAS domain-containing sensor histidine kinase [Pedobacter polaris]|nr:ATP-binding protein [Pedobacter polaris]
MGKLIRNFSWKDTILGDPEQWPSALKISVGIMLRSPFPMHITWGMEYIQLYNDAYRPVLGTLKHPKALGLPISESFPEIWDTVGPMFAGVMEGRPVRIQDFRVFLERSGFREECYFDFAYSPILDEQGNICGVLTNVIETTDKVNAFLELENTQEELRASQAHTAQERDRLMEFFRQAPAGICILEGQDLRFDMVNPLYQQLFPGRELLGKALLQAIPELLGDPIIGVLEEVMASGKTYHGTDELIPMSRTDGGEVENRYFDFTYQARLDGKGKAVGILVFAIEVTERKREEIRKNDFIGIVSHELKTPLTSLQAIVQLAGIRLRKAGSADGFLIDGMDRAAGQVKRMTEMINGFLNVSRLESGQIHIEKTQIDFTSLVVEAMEELQLSSSGHQLVMDCRDVHMVMADREKIISVVTNLMGNAVKYSPTGGRVEMDCSCNNGELVFSVSDQGLGIAPHDLERIFERYYRVSGRQTKNISGFGIGLYLSAEIVRLHGGKIWAQSELGKGSTFYFSLPLED